MEPSTWKGQTRSVSDCIAVTPVEGWVTELLMLQCFWQVHALAGATVDNFAWQVTSDGVLKWCWELLPLHPRFTCRPVLCFLNTIVIVKAKVKAIYIHPSISFCILFIAFLFYFFATLNRTTDIFQCLQCNISGNISVHYHLHEDQINTKSAIAT